MPKKLIIKEILIKNPHIKKSELRKFSQLGKELQKQGFRPKGYQLLPPYERRFMETDDDKSDPRTINLSSMRD